MTHSEFLNMVTPNEFSGYSMFTNKEGIRRRHVAGDAVGADEGDRQVEGRPDRARQGSGAKEVLEAMNQLEDARKKAGLPPSSRQP